MKPYVMYSGLYFRFDIAKNYFAKLLINLLQPSVWYNWSDKHKKCKKMWRNNTNVEYMPINLKTVFVT